MLTLIRKKASLANVKGVPEKVAEVLASAGFVGLVHQARSAVVNVFGHGSGRPSAGMSILTRSEGLRQFLGDIFWMGERGVIYYYFVDTEDNWEGGPRKPSLNVGLLAGREYDIERFDSFCAGVSKAVQEASSLDSPLALAEVEDHNPAFEKIRQEAVSECLPTDREEFGAASVLVDRSVRQLLLYVKRAGSLLRTDLDRAFENQLKEARRRWAAEDPGIYGSGAADAEHARRIQDLIDARLLARESSVICTKTGAQILRVKAPEGLTLLGQTDDVRCSCGEQISNARVDELFATTDLGDRMLDGSWWLTVKLVEILMALGVESEKIILSGRLGAEEVDAFVDHMGFLIMFELSDGRFEMGHAHHLRGRIPLYGPRFTVVVSTDGVAPEVRDYFDKSKPETEMVWVDAVDLLNDKLSAVLTRTTAERAASVADALETISNVHLPLRRFVTHEIGTDIPRGKHDPLYSRWLLDRIRFRT